jgi:hypothetical protein
LQKETGRKAANPALNQQVLPVLSPRLNLFYNLCQDLHKTHKKGLKLDKKTDRGPDDKKIFFRIPRDQVNLLEKIKVDSLLTWTEFHFLTGEVGGTQGWYPPTRGR